MSSTYKAVGMKPAGDNVFTPKATYVGEDQFMDIFDIENLTFIGKRAIADGEWIGGHSKFHEDDGDTVVINDYDYTDQDGKHRFITFYYTNVRTKTREKKA